MLHNLNSYAAIRKLKWLFNCNTVSAFTKFPNSRDTIFLKIVLHLSSFKVAVKMAIEGALTCKSSSKIQIMLCLLNPKIHGIPRTHNTQFRNQRSGGDLLPAPNHMHQDRSAQTETRSTKNGEGTCGKGIREYKIITPQITPTSCPFQFLQY